MSNQKSRLTLPNQAVEQIIDDLKRVAKTYNSHQGMVVKLADIERILNKCKKDKEK